MKSLDLLYKILPLLFWCLLIFGFDSPYLAILTALCALIHECGHLIFALPYKIASMPRADISGFRIGLEGASYKQELIVAMGGPIINLALFAIFISFFQNTPFAAYSKVFALVNLMTALSNLLPIEGYDGYRILFSFCALAFDDAGRCERFLSRLSFLLSVLMCFLSLYLILKLGEGYWIFFIFFSLTMSNIIRHTKGVF